MMALKDAKVLIARDGNTKRRKEVPEAGEGWNAK